MGQAIARFDADRAVSVLQNGKQRASGYLVADGLVLTCQHFLETGPLEVRPRASVATLSATLAWCSEPADAALLRCEATGVVAAVAIGVVEPVGRDSLHFDMYGWPLWSTERSVDDTLLEGGRLVRGIFEPWDTSSEPGNLVLQPTRTGGSVPSGWSGMSGAAVFSLDRLVGIQRRLLREEDSGSIEARPAAELMKDPLFRQIAIDAGITLERGWAPRGDSSSGGHRLELHGPSQVPLLSPVLFQLRIDGWQTVTYSFSRVANGVHQREFLPAAELIDIPAIFTDADQVSARGELIVEASDGAGDTRTLTHSFTVAALNDADLAYGFETVVRVLETVRAGGSPSRGLRAAESCRLGLSRLAAALRVSSRSKVVETISAGLGGVSECLAVETSQTERKLADQHHRPSEESRQISKYSFHRAYAARAVLRGSGLVVPADERTDAERDAAVALLGHSTYAAYLEYLDPDLKVLLADQDPYTSSFLRLLRSQDVDLNHPDFTGAVPQVQAKTIDLVNALITEGWARWAAGYQLTLTQVGRAALDNAQRP